MGAHSLLSPSSAKRWMRCAASVGATQHIPEKRTSKDAALGTAKHAVSETCLRTDTPPESWIGQTVEADGFKFVVDDEFIEHVKAYIAVVHSEPGKQFYEIKLDTSEVLGLADQGGTADCIVLDVDSDTLTVIDAKFGYNEVLAQDNEQGLLYIAGARRRYAHVAEWKTFRFIIAQPRVSYEPDIAQYTLAQVVDFEKRARMAGQEAFRLAQFAPELIEAEKRPSPEACQWCEIRATCAARTKEIVAMFTPIEAAPKAPGLDNAQLALYLDRVDDIKKWCKDLEAEAYARALAGQEIPTYMLGVGRRGDRYWVDPQKAVTRLLAENGIAPDDLFEAAPLKSPPDVEKLLKKLKSPAASLLKSDTEGALVAQNEGKPSLVKASPKVKPYQLVKPEFQPSMESLV